MRESIIKAKLARDEPALVTTLHFTDPSLFELVGLMGFDGIWMDLEHHGYSVETAQELMRATRVGNTDIVARPAKGEFMRMGRLLEAGATGILYPRCSDAAEAADVVRWSKFHPLGARGFDGAGSDAPFCSLPMDRYVERANAETFVAVQIEDRGALDRVEEIAAVDGVDVIFFGPGDFSVLGGFPGRFDHEEIRSAKERIAAAAKAAGKHWGMPAATPAAVADLLALGARFLACGADIILILEGLKRLQAELSALGFSFDNRLSAPSRSSS